MENVIARISEYAALYGVKIIGAIIILILGIWLAKLLTKLVKRFMGKTQVDKMLISFLGNLTYMILLVFVVLAALSNLGINVTSFIAIIGAAGLAIGLALQGSLSNFGAGVLIIALRPFKIGDVIDAGGALGVVEEIKIFSTILKTPDNRIIIIPNTGIIGGNIINYSAKDTRRVDLTFGVGYQDDLKKVRNELMSIINEDDRILKDPEPFVAVSELADSSVNFVVRVWVKSADYWGVHFDLNERVKVRFDETGISIPFPQRDVHLLKEDAS